MLSQASTRTAQTPTEDTTSAPAIKPEEVLPQSDGLTGTVASRARSGSSRGRGASSRARGGRRGDPRNGDRATPHDDASKDSDDKSRAFQKPRPSDAGGEAVTVAATTDQRTPAAQEQIQQSHDGAQRGGRGQRRPREQPRGQQYQRQDQPPRAQQEERPGQGAAQLPLAGQEFASPAQGVRANGQRDRRAPAPQPKGRPNPKSHPAPAAKNGWSGGNPVAQPTSPTPTAEPPVSRSWADEEPSPRTQPPPPPPPQQQQRAVGVSRSRHPSQQKAPPVEGQRTTDTRGLRQGQGGYGSAPSHEAGASRDSQQGSRGTQRQYQGRSNVTSGGGVGVAGAKPRRQAQIPVRGQNGPMSSGGFADGPNRLDYGEARSSAPAQGNMRGTGNGNGGSVGGGGGGGASQVSGSRKGRPAPSTRRRNGGTGGGSGSGARVPQQQQQGAPQRAS